MRKIKLLYRIFTVLIVISACTDIDELDLLNSIPVPTNVAAVYDITQDNTGLVTITPTAEGANSFKVYFGDATAQPATVEAGKNVQHTYAEGNYKVKIEAFNVKGDKAEKEQDLIVSFKAPQNLKVTLENDQAVSKQLNITATADFATMFEFYSGETGVNQPVATANIGETVKYQYQNAGKYNVRVVAKGAAIATTEFTQEFDVTAIVQPIASAPTPPSRNAADVISIYSSVYTDVSGTNTFPDWGQGGQGSSWKEFDLNGDKMLQYINLSYQGIQFGSRQDVSGMEFLHLDVWTADVDKLETSLINVTSATPSATTEKPVTKDLTKDAWVSLDIPISEYTAQGLSVNEILQLKFVGTPWASGTVFIDNIYFWKTPAVPNNVTPINFETGYSLSSFDGGDIAVVANPNTTGNSSSMVARLIKNAGQPWAGSKITLDTPFNFTNPVVKAKVWSPRAGLKLLMKFEDNVPWPNVTASAEVTATTTVANAWEELTFDFTGISSSIDFYNLVMIMDNGTQGDGSANYTIYVDDIATTPSLNFEPKFSLSGFDGGEISVVANPNTTGNTSAMVAKMIKNAGQPWAGSKITVPEKFSFVGQTRVKLKVWSPRAGLNLLMKFEDDVPWPNVTASAEVTATTTTANAWEELTFDFSAISTSVSFYNLVMIMDNGTQGDGSGNYTIYIDDITQF
ncbi:surface glycan-binding lipoprotein precursor [Tenacibaculum litopenaei]|uniref:PKD domain protein n=1 Tax=Tenacibaculum litopenaei TaxID=396016 RepID=UPI0038961EF2